MKCFYHADADGICSGFWVWASRVENDTDDYIKMDYGKAFPFDIIKPDEEVWFVDYSIEPVEMTALLEKTDNITWIDHHKTAIDKYEYFPWPIKGTRLDGTAGCMLTYLYTHPDKTEEQAPYFTKLIADYDTWTFRYGDSSKLFQIAFTAHAFEPWSQEWDKFFDATDRSYEVELIDAGREMQRYRDGWAKSVMELGFETKFRGHSCFAVNLPRCNSNFFDSLEKEYDILMPFYWNGEFWSVSLYSNPNKIDVSIIAKQYGGGGHKGAAGFQCKRLPFRKEKK